MDLSSLPSLGDAFKSACDELGIDDEKSDWVVAAACLATGDYVGATKYGMSCYGHLGADGVDPTRPHVQVSKGYDLETAEGWYQWMHDDPDRAIQAYHDALRAGSLPDELTNDPTFQMEMSSLVQGRNRELTAISSLQQSIHDTLKQLCSFRV